MDFSTVNDPIEGNLTAPKNPGKKYIKEETNAKVKKSTLRFDVIKKIKHDVATTMYIICIE